MRKFHAMWRRRRRRRIALKCNILTCCEYFGIHLGEFTPFQLEISLFSDEGAGDTVGVYERTDNERGEDERGAALRSPREKKKGNKQQQQRKNKKQTNKQNKQTTQKTLAILYCYTITHKKRSR